MKLADRLLAPVDTDQVSLTNASIVHSFWMVILELVSKTEYEMWSNEATEISEISSLVPPFVLLMENVWEWVQLHKDFSSKAPPVCSSGDGGSRGILMHVSREIRYIPKVWLGAEGRLLKFSSQSMNFCCVVHSWMAAKNKAGGIDCSVLCNRKIPNRSAVMGSGGRGFAVCVSSVVMDHSSSTRVSFPLLWVQLTSPSRSVWGVDLIPLSPIVGAIWKAKHKAPHTPTCVHRAAFCYSQLAFQYSQSHHFHFAFSVCSVYVWHRLKPLARIHVCKYVIQKLESLIDVSISLPCNFRKYFVGRL